MTAHNSITVASSGPSVDGANGVTFNSPILNLNGQVESVAGDINVQSNAVGFGLTVNMGAGSVLLALAPSNNVNFNTTNPGAITITGGPANGLISAGNAVNLDGGAGAVNVNVKQIIGCVRPSGSSVNIQTSTGNLTFCLGIDTSSGSGSGGSINVAANGGALDMGAITTNGNGIGNSAGNVTLSAANGITVGDINANGTGGASGGAISLNGGSQGINGTLISATGTGAGNGGSVSTGSGTLVLTSQNGSGNSIDVSASGTGNGGSVSVTTTSPIAFTIGGGAGTGNGTAGNISANGVNGGNIVFTNYGTPLPVVVNQVINGTITANGTTGAGGTVLFQGQQPAGSAPLQTQFNGGLVQATNTADNSGIIGFNGGPGQLVVLSGTGTVHAGQVVRAGNLDPNTLALLPQSAGLIIVSPSVSISNSFETNGFIPPPPPGPPTPVNPSTGGRGFLIPQFGQESTNNEFVLSKTDTDFTPIYGYVSVNEEDERRSKKKGKHKNIISIPGAKSYGHVFDGTEISKLTSDGMKLNNAGSSNRLDIDKGNVLLSPDKEIVVGTHEGNVHILPGAIAFVMESGNDVVIYNLRQSAANQVTVGVGEDTLVLHPGSMMVLTRQHVNDFEDIDAECHMISYRGAYQLTLRQKEIKAFVAEFSIASAILAIQPLSKSIDSSNKTDAAMLAKIVKGAVILSDFSGTVDLEQMDNLSVSASMHVEENDNPKPTPAYPLQQ